MIRKKKGLIEWLEYEIFKPFEELKHGFFLRHGGVSKDAYASLNFGLSHHDLPANVESNKKRILDCLGLERTCSSLQVHGDVIQEVHSTTWDSSTECDGMMTNEKNVGLLIKHADCQGAIFFDPKKRVIANVHCGWRGNVQNIYEKTILDLKTRYLCDPKDILVGISPSLGPEAAEFRNFDVELPRSFWKFQVKPTYFDLWEISKWQLMTAGILEDHIEIARMCTRSNPNDFFSYRREKASGRHASVVALIG